MDKPTDRLVWGILAHMVADWLLQNAWQSDHKAKLGHPAGIVHAMIHVAALAFVFPKRLALLLGVVHYLIDLRFLLRWWRGFIRQTTDPAKPESLHVAIWGDQVLHIVCIALVAALSRRKA